MSSGEKGVGEKMQARVTALERVVLSENVDKPRGKGSNSPGLDKVFERAPKMGRFGYDLFLVERGGCAYVAIRDPESGHTETVPIYLVRQFREAVEP